MTIYLSSPKSQQQAEHVADMPVLLSYAMFDPWILSYQQSFGRILIDSGVFSEHQGGRRIEIEPYRDWAEQWRGHADAIAGIDDMSGDWRRSIANYQAIPWSFPTWHDTDPLELLNDLVPMARERGHWIGVSMLPPRQRKEQPLREAIERIPEDLHIHGWALRAFTHIRRINSVDTTDWWRYVMTMRTHHLTRHLTPGECLDIVVKRYQRWTRTIGDKTAQTELFDGLDTEEACAGATSKS